MRAGVSGTRRHCPLGKGAGGLGVNTSPSPPALSRPGPDSSLPGGRPPSSAGLAVGLAQAFPFLCGLCLSHTVGHWCQADFLCEASQKTRVAFRIETPPQCVDFLFFYFHDHLITVL